MIELLHTDCTELMAGLPDKAFDLAIVDPPFFKRVANGSFYGKGLSGSGNKRGVYRKIDNWDTNIPTNNYYKELVRVSKNQIIWGINYFHFEGVPVGRVIWDKQNDSSTFSKAEIASCSLIDSVQMIRYTWAGFMQGPTCQVVEPKIHPTQKPIPLYKQLLTDYAKPGDKILDTHGGSMSIAIACHDMGFDLTCCELDADYYKEAVLRFNRHKAQQQLFNPKETFEHKQAELF